MEPLVANVVYAIVKKEYSVSRSERINWYLQLLNSNIKITKINDLDNTDGEMTIVSVIPHDPPKNWTAEASDEYEYLVTLNTDVMFVGQVYNFVYCLDMSPSIAVVDTKHGQVLIDLIISAMTKCVESLVKPFIVPGRNIQLYPDIHVTVIAHTPFYITPAQQVLVQGWKLTADNSSQFLSVIQQQLEFMENATAEVSTSVNEQLKRRKSRSNALTKFGTIMECVTDRQSHLIHQVPNIAMVSPGSGLLNILRYGLLGLKLLPSSNFSSLMVVTDGMIIMPDMDTLDSVLNHMRYNDISCSFLHIGSLFNPHNGLGYVPYFEIIQLLCVSTGGSFLQLPVHDRDSGFISALQHCFLHWNLKKKNTKSTMCGVKEGERAVMNNHFCGNISFLTRKHAETDINVSLLTILSCRVREGFVINDVQLTEDKLNVTLVLPWSNNIFVECSVSCKWPVAPMTPTLFHCTLGVKSPYEFLHDISCRYRAPVRSPYRQILITRFWNSLKSFAHGDALLSHLEPFTGNYASYCLPESVSSGSPLYQLQSGSSHPTLVSNDLAYSEFTQAWKPVCFLDHNLWQKWFYTGRIGVVLRHDEPLCNNILRRRYNVESEAQGLQCREASTALYALLKSWASFVLIENHSYVNFLFPSELGPEKYSFCVAKLVLKPPYAVIHIAFLYNIPERIRLKVIKELRQGIRNLEVTRLGTNTLSENSNSLVNVKCCVMLEKPLEKILVRYEQTPSDFRTVIFPDGTQPSRSALVKSPSNNALVCSLSRYLHHKRWIWSAYIPDSITLPLSIVENVLSTLVRVRLKEGFYFARCNDGIGNMVLEVRMKNNRSVVENHDDRHCSNEQKERENQHQMCIIQYILFPPHFKNRHRRVRTMTPMTITSTSERMEIISECWIEPQHGFVTSCPPNRSYLSGLQYQQIPDAIWAVDAECISVLFTFEYVKLLCENVVSEQPASIQPLLARRHSNEYWPNAAPFAGQRIKEVPFPYSIAALCFKCQQRTLEPYLFTQDIFDPIPCTVGPNKLLLDSVYNYLRQFHTKEISFSEDDCRFFLQQIKKNFKRSSAEYDSSLLASQKQSADSTGDDVPEVLPSAEDWIRLISWALEGADDGETTLGDYSVEENLQHVHVKYESLSEESSEKCDLSDNHRSSIGDIYDACISDDSQLKWKCYIKLVSKSHCLITLVPSSYSTIRSLMLEGDSKNVVKMKPDIHVGNICGIHSYDTDISADNSHSPQMNVQDSVYDSCSTSKGFVSEIELQCDDIVVSPYGFSAKLNIDELEYPFRVRANTWDPVQHVVDMQQQNDFRLRTNSLGAKCRPLFRLKRKSTIESVSGGVDLSVSEYASLKHPHYMTLPLPIYVFNCPIDYVIEVLIKKSGHLKPEDIRKISEISSNYQLISDRKYDRRYRNQFLNRSAKLSDHTVIDEDAFEKHCSLIETAFTKCYVSSLFKSLHLGHSVSAFDVQTTFEKCDESLLAIDITGYLKVVCNHLRNIESITDGNIKVTVGKSKPCCDDHVHKLVKKRFFRAITTDFKPIQSKPDSYYCSPLWAKERKMESGPLSPAAAENQSGTISEEHATSCSVTADASGTVQNPAELKTSWDVQRNSINSEDDACTSLLSNMDSDSLNGGLDESMLDDVQPLFLHFVCHVSSDKFICSSPVDIVPTCICELLHKNVDTAYEFDTENLRIILDVHCLTLPISELTQNSTEQNDSLVNHQYPTPKKSFSNQNSQKNLSFEEGNVPKEILNLPDYQYSSLAACITQVEWLMKDEVVTFLLDICPPGLDTLQLVCDHIATSPTEIGCFIERVPLSFVLGADLSLHKFLQDFALMKIPDYHLEKEADYYYLVKENSVQSEVSATNENVEVLTVEKKREENPGKETGAEFSRSEEITDTTVPKNICRPMSGLPNFWLIMCVGQDYVTVYFHCRCSDVSKREIRERIGVCEMVIKNIKDTCKLINQNMLLQNLYETRLCHSFLEPPQEGVEDEDEIEEPPSPIVPDINHKFLPGCFACKVVFEKDFTLHPRLKAGPIKCGISRGIQAVCSVLSRFNVNNRKNLFVYQDENKNVFYLRLYEYTASKTRETEECPSRTFSRSSSFTSLNKRYFEDQLPFVPGDLNTKIGMTKSSVEDKLTLKVYGVSEVGHEIERDLVEVLQNRLHDAILDVISVMLTRNPHCRLLPDDVHFIQNVNESPSCILKFRLDNRIIDDIQLFGHYLRKNILHISTVPKYTDPKSCSHFQDYCVHKDTRKKPMESDMYLYNQIPPSDKGVACISLIIFNKDRVPVEYLDYIRYTADVDNRSSSMTLDDLKSLTNVAIIPDSSICNGVIVEFRIWKRGRINVELLGYKLNLTIRHALWELIMELKLLTALPLHRNEEIGVCLSYPYHSILPSWLTFGNELNVPCVIIHEVPMIIRHNLHTVLKELNGILAPYNTSVLLFIKRFTQVGCSQQIAYVPFTWQDNYTFYAEDSCLLLCRNIRYFSEDRRIVHMSLNEDQYPNTKNKILMIILTNSKASLCIYNWPKDEVDRISKAVTSLGEWVAARNNLLSGIIQQKLGLFHSQPFQRDIRAKQMVGKMSIENFTRFSLMGSRHSTGPQIVQLFDTFKDMKISRPIRRHSFKKNVFMQNVQQLIDIHSADKKGSQRYLYNIWQTKSFAQNIVLSDDVLQMLLTDSRLVHYCLTPLLFIPKWRIQAAATRDHTLSLKTRYKLSNGDRDSIQNCQSWYTAVCHNFVSEYKQYLHSLGFTAVQTALGRMLEEKNKSIQFVRFLQKSLLGGILLFQIYLSELFFHVKLHALEYSRLKSKTASTVVSQFAVSFMDECDRMKLQMHLHSFTYDYHLRCLRQYLLDFDTSLIDGYHVTSFLDDFIKYYPKAPNYARSLAFSDTMEVEDVGINSAHFFDYLLSHSKKYGMESFFMMPTHDRAVTCSEYEYILVRKKNIQHMCYKDSDDVDETDDFDVCIIMTHINSVRERDFLVQYYILIISRREMYPKTEMEGKLGKFRTVPTLFRSMSHSEKEVTSKQTERENECKNDPVGNSNDTSPEKDSGNVKRCLSNIEIRQESVNYLGYYSSHEEMMQLLMSEQVSETRYHIEWMIKQGSFDCITQTLWNKLLSIHSGLTYNEFQTLLGCAELNIVSETDKEIRSMLTHTVTLPQGISKMISAKYAEQSRVYLSPDTTTQKVVVLHPRHSSGFVMFSLDFSKSEYSLGIVYRKEKNFDHRIRQETKLLFNEIVNLCCYHIWLNSLKKRKF